MPRVRVELSIDAPLEDVWAVVRGVEDYPRYMENVRRVEVVDEQGHERTIAWSVVLKGSILEWTEAELVDESAHRITFHQVDGDLDRFDGYWQVHAGDGATEVILDIEFEIGIPLLAQMLDPVAVRALRDNSEHMLRGLEREVRAG